MPFVDPQSTKGGRFGGPFCSMGASLETEKA